MTVVLIQPAFAAELPRYAVDAEASKLKFTAIQNSAPVEGAFKVFSADIRFAPDKLEESSIVAEVEIGSMFAAYPEVAKTLQTAEWLDAARFPRASLRTLKISELPPANLKDDRKYYYADAELELRGVKAPVVLNFIVEKLDEKGAVASGHATLNRLDFGVGQGQWKSTDAVQNPVTVSFRIIAKRVVSGQ